MIEKVLTCRWSFLPYILDKHSTPIQWYWFCLTYSQPVGLSIYPLKIITYYLSSYTRESQLLRLRSTLTQIISYCVTSLFNQGQVRVFWFLETRPKNNRNYDNRESNETEITPHSLLVNSILKLFLIHEYTFNNLKSTYWRSPMTSYKLNQSDGTSNWCY